MNAQNHRATRFTSPTGEELVVLTAADYDALLAIASEEAIDAADSRAAIAVRDAGLDDGVPLEDLEKWLAAPSPVAYWLDRRGMTQGDLHRATEISRPFISKITRGENHGSPEKRKKIAAALRITVDAMTR